MQSSESSPGTGFARFNLSPSVMKGIAGAGFTEPRPIQAATIEAAMEGRDVLGLAQTGTGKTAAFAIPVIERLLKPGKPGPRTLIVAPTRELANQIETEIRLLAKFTPLKTAAIFGGVSFHRQIEAMRRRPEIIVACPGRLLDLVGERVVRLDSVEVLVLDEADHMFDMGFLPDLRRIISALPPKRQNLLFSATMPAEIRQLADGLLTTPKVVELAHSKPATTIQHALCWVADSRKQDLLKILLSEKTFSSAIVFTRTKHRAKRLADALGKAGFRAVALQGNMSQPQRDRAMSEFRSGRSNVLVATDIAARGLDIASVSHVINFDVPTTPDAYTHRIGRTGRSERQGQAYTFVTSEDRQEVRAIERKINMRIPTHEVPEFDASAPSAPAQQTFQRPQESYRQQARPQSHRQREPFRSDRPHHSGGRPDNRPPRPESRQGESSGRPEQGRSAGQHPGRAAHPPQRTHDRHPRQGEQRSAEGRHPGSGRPQGSGRPFRPGRPFRGPNPRKSS